MSMKVRFEFLNRKPGMSAEQFSAHWLDVHGPLVAQMNPHLREYWQNVVVERQQRGVDAARGPWDFDGLSQLWIDEGGADERAAYDGDSAQRIAADCDLFIGELHIVTAEQFSVVPVPDDPSVRGKLLKRISTLKRKPEVSESQFRDKWEAHRELVGKMPHVCGYRQNVVVSREWVKGTPCSYEQMPIDGLVEIWFETNESLVDAFASPEGQRTQEHGRTFLAEATAFRVEEHRAI